jgi:phage baseplate assembly protein W
MAEKQVVAYKDFNMNFAANPFSGDLSVLTNEKAVAQSLKNLLLTERGEIPFNPYVGSGIRTLLFEPASEVVTITLKEKIHSTIKNYEPRITLKGINIKDDPDTNSYIVEISYTITVSNNTYTASISLDRLQ